MLTEIESCTAANAAIYAFLHLAVSDINVFLASGYGTRLTFQDTFYGFGWNKLGNLRL